VTPILVDLRNVYRADEVHRKGFSYTGIGRPAAAEANAGDPQLAGFEVSS
jgi:UDPglucose 6-dehydrogenase